MSLEIPHHDFAAEAPQAPTNQALEELSDLSLSAPKRVTALFLHQITDLKEERKRIADEAAKTEEYYRAETASLKVEIKSLKKYQIAHCRLHTARSENAVASLGSLLLSGVGAVLIAACPRTEDVVPWPFIIGCTFVAIAVILGVVGRLCALGIRKWCPNLIDNGLDDDS